MLPFDTLVVEAGESASVSVGSGSADPERSRPSALLVNLVAQPAGKPGDRNPVLSVGDSLLYPQSESMADRPFDRPRKLPCFAAVQLARLPYT